MKENVEMTNGNLTERFRRSLRNVGGIGDLSSPSPQTLDGVVQLLPVSGQLLDFYAVADPAEVELPWFVEWLYLYPQHELVASQDGYRCAVGKPSMLLPGWQHSWIVVGDASGDPIIVDTSVDECPVLMALHGCGEWNARQIAPSFADFLQLLIAWLNLWNKNVGQIHTRDGELLSTILDEVRSSVTAHLSHENRAEFLKFVA